MKIHKLVLNSLRKEEKNILAFLLLVVYAYICGLSVPMLTDGNVSLGAYVLAVFTDQHYILYGLVIYGLYWMVRDIRTDSEIEKVRYGSYKAYYLVKIVCITVKVSIYILMHIVIAIFIGLNKFRLGIDFNIRELSVSRTFVDSSHIDILQVFAKNYSSVIVPIFISAVVLITGFVFIYVILLFSYELKGNRWVVAMVGIIVLCVLIGFKSFRGDVKVEGFMLNNYLIFHHILLYEKWIKYLISNMITVMVITYALYNYTIYRKSNKTSRRKGY